MTHKLALVFAAAGFACAAVFAQSSNPLSTEAKQAYTGVKNNILKAAEKMPEADYAFKATPEVRSFAQIVEHVIQAQTHTCAVLNGQEKSSTVAAAQPARDSYHGAMREGSAAYQEGCAASYNPHDQGSIVHAGWAAGFRQAEKLSNVIGDNSGSVWRG